MTKFYLLSDDELRYIVMHPEERSNETASMALELFEFRRIHGKLGCEWLSDDLSYTTSTPLTFGELRMGDHFIAFPVNGDDKGHGGYRGGSHLLVKGFNQVAHKVGSGVPVMIPASMSVIRVWTCDPVWTPPGPQSP